MMLAGVDLASVRTTPVYRKLPSSAAALADTLRNSTYLMVASTGTGYSAVARGDFRETPAGWERIAPELAAFGTPESIAAVRAQHRSGTSGAPALLSHAEPLAAHNPIWAVALGTATVPLTGNLANLNRFLHSTEYTTAAVRLTDALSLNITGICRTPGDAQHLEGTLRALISLANLRSPGPLAQAILATDDRTVKLSLAMDAAELDRLLR